MEVFVDAVSTYNDYVNVSEANALQGLPMLLSEAGRVLLKDTVKSWHEALQFLRNSYEPAKLVYHIYQELFSIKQKDNVPADILVLTKTREIELSLQEVDVTKDSGKTETPKNKERPRCVFCKNFGNTVDTCRSQKNLQRNVGWSKSR